MALRTARPVSIEEPAASEGGEYRLDCHAADLPHQDREAFIPQMKQPEPTSPRKFIAQRYRLIGRA